MHKKEEAWEKALNSSGKIGATTALSCTRDAREALSALSRRRAALASASAVTTAVASDARAALMATLNHTAVASRAKVARLQRDLEASRAGEVSRQQGLFLKQAREKAMAEERLVLAAREEADAKRSAAAAAPAAMRGSTLASLAYQEQRLFRLERDVVQAAGATSRAKATAEAAAEAAAEAVAEAAAEDAAKTMSMETGAWLGNGNEASESDMRHQKSASVQLTLDVEVLIGHVFGDVLAALFIVGAALARFLTTSTWRRRSHADRLDRLQPLLILVPRTLAVLIFAVAMIILAIFGLSHDGVLARSKKSGADQMVEAAAGAAGSVLVTKAPSSDLSLLGPGGGVVVQSPIKSSEVSFSTYVMSAVVASRPGFIFVLILYSGLLLMALHSSCSKSLNSQSHEQQSDSVLGDLAAAGFLQPFQSFFSIVTRRISQLVAVLVSIACFGIASSSGKISGAPWPSNALASWVHTSLSSLAEPASLLPYLVASTALFFAAVAEPLASRVENASSPSILRSFDGLLGSFDGVLRPPGISSDGGGNSSFDFGSNRSNATSFDAGSVFLPGHHRGNLSGPLMMGSFDSYRIGSSNLDALRSGHRRSGSISPRNLVGSDCEGNQHLAHEDGPFVRQRSIGTPRTPPKLFEEDEDDDASTPPPPPSGSRWKAHQSPIPSPFSKSHGSLPDFSPEFK